MLDLAVNGNPTIVAGIVLGSFFHSVKLRQCWHGRFPYYSPAARERERERGQINSGILLNNQCPNFKGQRFREEGSILAN